MINMDKIRLGMAELGNHECSGDSNSSLRIIPSCQRPGSPTDNLLAVGVGRLASQGIVELSGDSSLRWNDGLCLTDGKRWNDGKRWTDGKRWNDSVRCKNSFSSPVNPFNPVICVL